MTPEKIEALRQRRAAVAESRDELLATPIGERRSKRGSIADWNKSIEDVDKLLAQMDSLLARVEAKAAAKSARVALPRRTREEPEDSVCVAAVRKGPNAEVRIRTMTWEGTPVVDIRLWSRPKVDDGEYVPTRKGVMFAADKLGDVIAGFELARQQPIG